MSLTEEEFWRQQVLEGRRTQLEAVRKAATSWSELFAAVLSLFGTVTFAGGLASLEDLEEGLQTPVKLATLAAALLMLSATVLAGLASGHSAATTSDNTWQGMRTSTNKRADRAREFLSYAKICGLGAGVIVLLGSAVILLAGEAAAPAKTAPTVVAIVDGEAVCGALKAGSDGALMVDDVPLRSVSTVEVVDACP